jgi:amidase
MSAEIGSLFAHDRTFREKRIFLFSSIKKGYFSMKTAARDFIFNVHSRHNAPQFSVKSAEEFVAKTELCTGGWLNSIHDSWTPDKTCALNPTVCVAIEDAHPGDILEVKILDIIPDKVGYTGFNKDSNPIANLIRNYDWGLNVRTVEIKKDVIIWNDQLSLPIHPMIGTLGTAPAEEELSNAKAGNHGGNMDVQEVCAGTTIYLPVAVESALLHIGDVHALQGDGEINCSGGIECRSEVHIVVNVIHDARQMNCVHAENDEFIMAISCGRSLEETFYTAANEILEWMCNDYLFTVEEAYLLMGQVMQARSTQFVNPTRTYICKMPKCFLKPQFTKHP